MIFIVYATTYCDFCKKAKDLLESITSKDKHHLIVTFYKSKPAEVASKIGGKIKKKNTDGSFTLLLPHMITTVPQVLYLKTDLVDLNLFSTYTDDVLEDYLLSFAEDIEYLGGFTDLNRQAEALYKKAE